MTIGQWFSQLPLLLNVGIFAVCAAIVWVVGSRLTVLADVLSDEFKISRSTIGLLFLALATSLPEVVTTLTAAVQSQQTLVLNNLFGGIALQTAILAIADGFARGALSNYPRKTDHAMQAVLLIALLAIVLIATLLLEPFVIGQVGLGSMVVVLCYIGVITLLRNAAGDDNWIPVDLPEPDRQLTNARAAAPEVVTKHPLLQRAVGLCLVILVVGVALVHSSVAIASQSGLGTSFIGVTLLATATSLPELSTTITAVRVGAYTLAISNIFGSNLIMLALILPADLLYRDGPILRLHDINMQLSIVAGILVTTVYIVGLLYRRKIRVGNFGIDSILVLIIYLVTVLFFYLSR
ncbi:MAG: hypothetical protein KTR35_15265 [Gammaproteobacteria bacterium]|nr:hypothetical protein [Gammaproteobacteria bacterium]